MARKNKRGIVFLCIGLALLLLAGGFWMHNIIEDKNAGTTADEILSQFNENLQTGENEENDDNEPIIMVNGEAFCGKVVVEKLSIELPVFDDWNYDKLKEAPCRYSGSIDTNDLIIAAHNYASHFGNLKKLEIGDKVSFIDAYGNRHYFAVKEVITLDGIAISDMLDGDWDFTLFTCTKGGEHRVTVRCNTVSN